MSEDNYKKVREKKYKEESKQRLSKALKKKIETTMIGALSTIEQHFSFLWNGDANNTTKEQEYMKNLYNKIRSEILDKGNNQARNIDIELSQYDVELLRFSIKIPVIPPKYE
jgi:hypothetical protein